MLPENQMQECIAKARLVRVLANRCRPFAGRHLSYPSRRLAVQTFALFVDNTALGAKRTFDETSICQVPTPGHRAWHEDRAECWRSCSSVVFVNDLRAR
jgi:hypothetical protein